MKYVSSTLRVVLAVSLTVLSSGLVQLYRAPAASAARIDGDAAPKVTICHRTNSVSNPYVRITVDQDSVDGDAANDNGQGDHYLEHNEGLFDPATMTNGDDWGDIIPPIDGVHDGLNWSEEGQAIYDNNCELPDEPVEPTEIPLPAGIADVCGTGNDTVPLESDAYEVSADSGWVAVAGSDVTMTRTITYTTTDDNVVFVYDEAAAAAGWTYSDDGTSVTYTYTDWGTACEVAPCTVTNQTFTAPWTFDDNTNPSAGAYPDGTPGTFAFIPSGLHVTSLEVESYVYGSMSAGATPLRDIDAMSYKTLRNAASTGNDQVIPAYILSVDLDGSTSTTDDQTYLFYEPIYNGTVETGVWQTWDVLGGGDSVWWSFDLTDGNPTLTWSEILADYPEATALSYGFNLGTYNQGTDAVVQDITFDCATTHFQGGQVLGDDDPTPPTPTTPKTPVVAAAKTAVLPATLPATGGSNNPFLIIMAALATYAAVYFAQGRRRLDQN